MAKVHLIFGILLFIVFTITGRFMRADFPDKEAIDQSLRILMRSRHIYILFSALIHLGLGLYLQVRPALWQKALQYLGSTALFVSSALLVTAFIIETYNRHRFSDVSRLGIYLSLLGIGLHMFGGFRKTGGRYAD